MNLNMVIIYSFGVWNLAVTLFCYLILRRKKTLFEDRFATTITKTATSITSLLFGLHFSLIISAELSTLFMCTTIFGILIGALFGSLVKYHSLLVGMYHGIIGSSMGLMIGEVLKNPQLCSIPIASHQQLLMNMYQICGFATLLLTFVISLVLYSLRV
ncbi:hypothetical protein ABZ756_04855 [Mammaliicoccus sciuri]